MYTRQFPQFLVRDPRHEAVTLRRHGVTYDEILERYGVAKSTLWHWLKTEGLVESDPQRLTNLKRAAQRRGAAAQHQKRLRSMHATMDRAAQDVGALSMRELWLVGVALYWAEGAKQREGATVSHRAIFSNMDPRMLRLYLAWLVHCCRVDPAAITIELSLHERADADVARQFWAREIPHPAVATCPVHWKRHNPSPHRQNVGRDYHGLLRIVVRRSTELNRRIAGWIQGLDGAHIGELCNGSTVAFGATSSGSNPDSPATFSVGAS